jgi:subtilisin family serine protease
VGLLALGAQANAGELLRLKAAGTIALQDQSARIARGARMGLDESRHPFVVQYVSAITEADKGFLMAQGFEIVRYIPDDALLVRGSDAAAAFVKTASSRVRAVSPFSPEWKISPEFWQDPAAGGAIRATVQSPEHLLISALTADVAQEAARQIGLIAGARVEGVRGRDIVATAAKIELQAIAQIDTIEWIQRVPTIVSFALPMDAPADTPPAAVTGYETGTKLMGFEAAWKRGYRGEGQIAAVADTGLDTGDVSTLDVDFKSAFLKGYLSGLGTESWQDSMGHGTHVCGSIVGSGELSGGAFKGGANGARLMIEGLWSAILDNLAPGTDIAAILDPIYKDGARIHSNSWGNASNLGEYDTFAANVDEYMWNNPDLLVLFAAGNSGVDADHDGHIDEGSISSPGTAKNVLTVGASKNLLKAGGIQKQMKDLRDGDKNWGVEPIASSLLSDAYDANYAYSGGTSMATPLTAGAATVTREFLVKARGLADPSAALVKATLLHTATDLYPGQFGTGPQQELPTRRPNVHEGYGRVDMDAVTSLGSDAQIVDDKSGVGLSEEKALTYNVGSAGTLRATLVYTDAPASASAARALVNDLDLKITGPDGKVYQKQDRVNNTEMLELSGLAPGAYRVSVLGINVPQGRDGKQPYALVVSR